MPVEGSFLRHAGSGGVRSFIEADTWASGRLREDFWMCGGS
jgi:hypothetical protein